MSDEVPYPIFNAMQIHQWVTMNPGTTPDGCFHAFYKGDLFDDKAQKAFKKSLANVISFLAAENLIKATKDTGVDQTFLWPADTE